MRKRTTRCSGRTSPADRQTDGPGAEVRADDSAGGRTGLCRAGRSGTGITSAGDADHESTEPGARYSGGDSVLEMGNGRKLRNLRAVHPANEFAAAVERPASALGSSDIKNLRSRVTAIRKTAQLIQLDSRPSNRV